MACTAGCEGIASEGMFTVGKVWDDTEKPWSISILGVRGSLPMSGADFLLTCIHEIGPGTRFSLCGEDGTEITVSTLWGNYPDQSILYRIDVALNEYDKVTIQNP